MIYRTTEDLYRAFKEAHGREPKLETWEYLEERHRVSEVLYEFEGEEQEEQAQRLFDEIRSLEDFSSRPARSRTRHTIPPDTRARARARILAAEAAQIPEVATFRSEVLRGHLLRPDRVLQWIKRKAGKQSAVSGWSFRLENTDGSLVRAPWAIEAVSPDLRSSLELTLLDGESPVHFGICADGILGRLKSVSLLLEGRYRWPEHETIQFLLAGVPPTTGPIAKVLVDHSQEDFRFLRITIEADPTASPREVADLFSKARSPERTRSKPLSKKHAELGVFASAQNDGRTWAEAMTNWNFMHPEEQYGDAGRFTRDCRQAYKRIMRTEIRWRRRPGARSRNSKG